MTEKQLDILIAYGPRLRAAGYQSVTIGDDGVVSIVLLPPDPVASDVVDAPPPKAILDDAETYGLPEGADVPGFRRPDDL